MTDLGSYMLVCGSRDWPKDKRWFITAKMIELRPDDAIILTGGASGVDQWAAREARRLNWPTHQINADWWLHGKRAGILRNLEMLDLNPVLVLAFHWGQSKGTAHTIRAAAKRGIPFHRFTEESMTPDLAAIDSTP